MYGVASMNIDKISGADIKNLVCKLTVAYFAVLALAAVMPERIIDQQLGYSVLDVDRDVHRFRQRFTLEDPNLANFEIVISDLKAIALQGNLTQQEMETEVY